MQVDGQVMPLGLLVMFPWWYRNTLSRRVWELVAAKFAVTSTGWFPVIVHGPVPVQPLLQLEKFDPDAGVAVRVTTVAVA
jgi:hypothetical protein